MTSAFGKNTGPSLSATVTVNDALEWLPSGSVAVQVTGVVPMGNFVLGRGEQFTLVPAWPSSIEVGGMKNTVAPSGPVACVEMCMGTVLTGGPLWPGVPVVSPIAGGVTSSDEGALNEARNALMTVGCSGTAVTSSQSSTCIDPL